MRDCHIVCYGDSYHLWTWGESGGIGEDLLVKDFDAYPTLEQVATALAIWERDNGDGRHPRRGKNGERS